MDVFTLFLLLLSCRIHEAGAQVKLLPETLTVLRGDEARFTCSTSDTQWTSMVWLLNGTVALTISNEHGLIAPTNLNVTAEKSPASKGDSWVFVLKNTERLHEGKVTCDLQGIDRKTARLFVQEKGSVNVFGGNKLAFRGQSVLFECQAAGWYPQPTLQWQVNGKKVSEGEYNISSEGSEKSLFTVTSNLSVTAAKSSRVDCLASVSAVPEPLMNSVNLTVVAEVVQEEGDDCTTPLAVTASLSALLLLLLLCICTVLCYRQRRQAKPSPEEPMWFDQSVNRQSSVAEATGGKVNMGYSIEGPMDAVYNELNMANRTKMDFASFRKVPDLVISSSQSQCSESQEEESSKNIRRITTV